RRQGTGHRHSQSLRDATRIWYLRIQRFHRPAPAGTSVKVTLVETARPRFPEFNSLGTKSEAGPEGRPRHFFPFKFLLVLRDSVGEIVRTLDCLALNRSPRPDLALPRSRREIRVGFLV